MCIRDRSLTDHLPFHTFRQVDGSGFGTSGLVPAPLSTEINHLLAGDSTWTLIDTDNMALEAVTTNRIEDEAVEYDKLNISDDDDSIVRDDSDSVLIRSYDATTTFVLDIPSEFPESRQAVQHNFKVFRDAHLSEYGTAEGIGRYPSDSLDPDNAIFHNNSAGAPRDCLLYTSPSPRDRTRSRMPSSA